MTESKKGVQTAVQMYDLKVGDKTGYVRTQPIIEYDSKDTIKLKCGALRYDRDSHKWISQDKRYIYTIYFGDDLKEALESWKDSA